MAWVFRQDITGPKGATGDQGEPGMPGRIADAGTYYDRVRAKGGPIPTSDLDGGLLAVQSMRGVEEPGTGGTRIYLQWRYIRAGTSTWVLGDWPA